MDNVSDLEASKPDRPDPFHFVVKLIAVQISLCVDVSKHAVALAFPNVERLSVPRVNEPIDISPESPRDIRRDVLVLFHSVRPHRARGL